MRVILDICDRYSDCTKEIVKFVWRRKESFTDV